ncbi:MAG: hypothetical protein RID22_21935, partial [Roseibium aggregatum]
DLGHCIMLKRFASRLIKPMLAAGIAAALSLSALLPAAALTEQEQSRSNTGCQHRFDQAGSEAFQHDAMS